MRQKAVTRETPSQRIVKDIRRRTRKHHSAEEKIRILLEGLRGEESIAELCRPLPRQSPQYVVALGRRGMLGTRLMATSK